MEVMDHKLIHILDNLRVVVAEVHNLLVQVVQHKDNQDQVEVVMVVNHVFNALLNKVWKVLQVLMVVMAHKLTHTLVKPQLVVDPKFQTPNINPLKDTKKKNKANNQVDLLNKFQAALMMHIRDIN